MNVWHKRQPTSALTDGARACHRWLVAIPPARGFRGPVLRALADNGGEATNARMIELVRSSMSMTDDDLAVRHRGDGSRTEVEYRLAWARTVLKSEGLIERVQPQLWRLTEKGRNVVSGSDSERATELIRL